MALKRIRAQAMLGLADAVRPIVKWSVIAIAIYLAVILVLHWLGSFIPSMPDVSGWMPWNWDWDILPKKPDWLRWPEWKRPEWTRPSEWDMPNWRDWIGWDDPKDAPQAPPDQPDQPKAPPQTPPSEPAEKPTSECGWLSPIKCYKEYKPW